MPRNKHRNRNADFLFQLPAFLKTIERTKALSILDMNMVDLLGTVMDALGNIIEFGGFQEPDFDELDLSEADVSFAFGCQYCDKKSLGVIDLLDHIMAVDHPKPRYAKSATKLHCLRQTANAHYKTFLLQNHEIMIKNRILKSSLDKMYDLYFTTKKFRVMCEQYLNCLKNLEACSSIIVGRNVKNLLDQIESMLTNARIIETTSVFSTMEDFVTDFRVVFVSKGKVFLEVCDAINHARTFTPSVYRNIFSLHQLNNISSQPNNLGGPSMENQPGTPPCHLPRQPFQQMLPNKINPPSNCTDAKNPHQLPPLNRVCQIENRFINDNIKKFLEEPELDSLIESGNFLITFGKSSVIPGELVCALVHVAPNVKVETFGAKVSGIGYEEDFINLNIDDGTKPKTADAVKTIVKELMRFFADNCDEWTIHNTVDAGVRSHLTVKNICENVCCRISFDSQIYCSNSNLILYYVKTYPICQKMCFFMQEFLKLVDLNFNRYIIVLLIIFYLQRRDYLPTVLQLQSNLSQEELYGSWTINFTPKTSKELKLKDCETDLRKSVTDFFQFYGLQFSFKESVVCPNMGLAINRTDFLPENNWRMPIKRYKAYVEACQSAEGADKPKFSLTPMCVQDLLELQSNVSQTIDMKDTDKFVQVCKAAYNYYSNNQ